MASSCAHAGGVVDRAVVDRVARRRPASPIAEVVVVRGVDDDLVARASGRCPRRRPRTLAGLDLANRVARAAARCARRAAPAGSRGFGRLDELVEVLAGRASTSRSAGVLGRSSRRPARRGSPPGGSSNCSPLQELCTTCQRIAGRRRGVDDDRPRRALPRGALVLVGPAAVVEPALAGEELRVPVRVVVEHHQDLALAGRRP